MRLPRPEQIWTHEQRYRFLKSPDEIRELHDICAADPYRQTFHVQPICGLSSDPNGFAYHKGVWHLYYQWCPWGAVHGVKYWYHASSPDLVHWKNEGIGMAPDTYYDNMGCHSGSGIALGDDLYLLYTGNHRDENWVRTPYTCAAKLGEDGKLTKLDKPLFGPRTDYSEHQRDPKVVYVPEKKKYYIFIGAQNLQKQGRALMYCSDQPLSGWEFAGELKVPGFEDFGGMWECPCILRISGKDVLIFSPQYTKLPGRAESTNHNVYLVGQMDYDTLTFTPDSGYEYLDFGFDFYAAQAAANVDDPDKGILISWIGLPDNHYPAKPENWEGTMIVPRELTIRDGKLYQNPVKAFEAARTTQAPADGNLPKACDMLVTAPEGAFDLNLFTKADGSDGFTIHYDEAKKALVIDKSKLDERFNDEVGEVLEVPVPNGLKSIRAIIDSCSLELYINDGEKTFSAHVYPHEGETHYTVTPGAEVTIWNVGRTVVDDFVV